LKEEKMDLSNHQIHEQIINSSDPSLSWNGAWLDPSFAGYVYMIRVQQHSWRIRAT